MLKKQYYYVQELFEGDFMKLWETKNSLNKEVEEFLSKDDIQLDQKLIESDCIASIAHSKLLQKMKILTFEEQKQIEFAFNEIISLNTKGKFILKIEDEDSHTAIENYLTEKLGVTGKKIHTLRSRNDQVLVALKIYSKKEITEIISLIESLINEIDSFSEKNKNIKMPGYTHMQKAMPYSVSEWINSFKNSFQDDLKLIKFTFKMIDKNPLGSAACFGLPVEIDKKITTDLLGFSSFYENDLYTQNSRGKFDSLILFSLLQIMLDLNKLATDLMLFTTNEFGFFELPSDLCTGSSIMPQKKNPDVLEIMRGNYSIMFSYLVQVLSNSQSLMSGYNRDVQLTKNSLMQGFELIHSNFKIAQLVISNLKVNKEKLENACTSEIYTAENVIQSSLEGTPFREAYKNIKEQL